MGQALYRKYRSKSLDEIVGQSHITDMLARAIKADKVAHGYLLTGPRGVGKTSIARILAHEINQLPYTDESVHLDIIEIDAASNNSVEDIRDLRDKVQIAPTSAKRKVYIIDEVHMLSKPAFNALLKTLEEPPEHVVFILATTDVDKLPATIISRVQRFNFRLIHPKDTTSSHGESVSEWML
jgi:DNA polymerase-3 subunit gamma/tau